MTATLIAKVMAFLDKVAMAREAGQITSKSDVG
jgi:hypothetical protein